MSTIKADTIVASDGTSPVTLTKQSAAKHFITYNESQTVTSSLNNSSITDVGTGNHRYNFANNFDTAEGYTCGGVMAWNTDQTTNVYSVQPLNKNDVLTSSLEVSTNYAGGTNDYYYNCSTSHGDLA
jgi:hypothetical protein